MTAEEAVDEMYGVVRDAWATSGYPDSSMLYPDVPGSKPPTSGPWGRVSIKHSQGGQTAFTTTDKKKYTQRGIFTIQIFAPVGDGLKLTRQLAQIILTGICVAHGGTVWYRNPRMQEVGSNGAYEQINVLTDFNYDDLR